MNERNTISLSIYYEIILRRRNNQKLSTKDNSNALIGKNVDPVGKMFGVPSHLVAYSLEYALPILW